MSDLPKEGEDEQLTLPVDLPHLLLPEQGQVITSQMTGNTYTIGQYIGEGYFGYVYSCKDSWENDLAAKILKPHFPPDTIKENAWAEFQHLFSVRHPFITYVYGAFELNGTCYIITERCYGPLSHLITIPDYNGSLWVRPIARCLLQAMHFIYLNGLVHKDIHLGNAFTSFTRDEMIPTQPGVISFKLGDLGIANFVQNIRSETTNLANWMLPPEYLVPEQFGPLDHRIDIYHCGLLLLKVWHGNDLEFTPEQVLAGAPREMALNLPPPYNFALEKALRRHVEYRTATPLELWRDLNSIAN